MSITVSCPSCKEAVSYPDDEAGQQVRCYRCGAPMSLAAALTPKGSLSDAADKVGKVADAGGKVYSFYTKLAASAGGLSGLLGVIGDLLKPLTQFNLVAFVTSAVLAALAVVLRVRGVRPLGRSLTPACAVLVCLSLGFGTWWGLAYFKGGRDKGYLAEHYPAADRLQSAVVTKVDGPKLGQEMREQQKAEGQAARSVEDALKGYPANVIRAEVVGKPRPIGRSGDVVNLEYDLKFSIDADKFDAVAAALVPVLDQAAAKKGEIVTSAEKDDGEPSEYLLERVAGRVNRKTATSARWRLLQGVLPSGIDPNRRPEGGEPDTLVLLNVARGGTGQNLTWRWYVVPDGPAYRPVLVLDVRFMSRGGKELNRQQSQLRVGQKPADGFGISSQEYNSGVKHVLIAPYHWNSDRIYCSAVTVTCKASLTQADLDQLGGIAVVLRP